MVWLPCPYLGRDVELTAERERHIRRRHSDLLPDNRPELLATLADPDFVMERPWSPSEVMLGRRSVDGALHVVVVVNEDDPSDDDAAGRLWVLTAYLAAELPDGLVRWLR